jgi:thiosulfate/3-mercaptopyruvate sulfurtransferase
MIEPFVDAVWFDAHRAEVVAADVRWYIDGRSGRAAYETGHIPGAVFVELGEVLAAPASELAGRHPLPEPGVFAAGLGALGIGDGDTVIAYDDAGGVIAARLVWMLRSLRHPAALLDGGLNAWSGSLETSSTMRPRSRFTPRPWPAARLVSIDDVARGSDILIDGRDLARYRGGTDPVDPRSGHIPGAVSLPARWNVGEDGRLLQIAELQERFKAAGIRAGTPVISYCGSGVTACHNLIALEHAGLGPGRLYPGSWSQWSRDPKRPVETGDPS